MAERRQIGAFGPNPPRTHPPVNPGVYHASKQLAFAGPRKGGGRVRSFHRSQTLAGLRATYSVRVAGAEAAC